MNQAPTFFKRQADAYPTGILDDVFASLALFRFPKFFPSSFSFPNSILDTRYYALGTVFLYATHCFSFPLEQEDNPPNLLPLRGGRIKVGVSDLFSVFS